jgi:Zn-dependent protease with chaperone function
LTPLARYFDGKTAIALPVSATLESGTLDGGMLILRGPDGTQAAAWPVRSVERCDGGHDADSATLRLKGGTARVRLDDAALLDALRAAGAAIGRQTRWGARGWGVMVLGLVASVAGAALLLDRLPELLAPLVPHGLESAWSNNAEAVFLTAARPCSGQPGLLALQGVVHRLAAAAGVSPPPEVTVLDTPMVNAFTLPDGRILLLRGLIDTAGDGDEVAGVLAHEMGHVQHHDATREMLRRIGLSMVARSLGWGGNLASELTGLSYGRQAEARADDAALVTLSRAGLRADGLGRFMARLQVTGGDGDLPAFLSDHPGTESRAARLRRPATGAPAFDDAGWQALRLACP